MKGVDFHPTEPWLLTGHYNGTVNIYKHEKTGAITVQSNTFEVAEVPVRCVESRKDVGSSLAPTTVHPTVSIVSTISDDMSVKALDWDKGWKNIQSK